MAAAMSFTACSSEEPVAQAGGDATVTFSVQLPGELNSRYGEGTTATNLKIAVYAKGETATPLNVFKLETGDSYTEGAYTSTIAMTKNVQMQLASGKTYTVVCWADAPGSIYTFSAADQKVTAKYETTTVANAEAYDAFFASQEITVSGNESKTIELRRPFAQLNVFTDDIAAAAAAGFTTSQTMVTVPVATTLNLVEGTVDDAVEQTFNYATLPSGKMGTTAYEYLLMNYLLTGTDKSIVDVKFAVKSAEGEERALTFNSVPVQRNYRTNIYGSLLTNAMNFNVVIKPEFADQDYNVVVTSADELAAAVAAGGEISVAEDITSLAGIDYATDKPTTIALNGHTLTLDATKAPYPGATTGTGQINAGANVTIKGGNLVLKSSALTAATLKVNEGGRFNLEDVHLQNATSAIWVSEKASELNVKNCVFDAACYGIATNAATTDQYVNINIENTTMTGIIPLLVNIPCTLNVTGCTINGTEQCIVVRGGNAVIKDSKLNFTGDASMVGKYAGVNDAWSSGNNIPNAPLTIGNKGASAYQYPTNVELINCELVNLGANKDGFPSVYAWANQGEGLGVTFKYDDACTFSHKRVYGSTNMTVNGVAITEYTEEGN